MAFTITKFGKDAAMALQNRACTIYTLCSQKLKKKLKDIAEEIFKYFCFLF